MLADALQYARACPYVRARRYYNRKAYDIQIEHIEQASSFKASDNIEIVYVCLCVFMKKKRRDGIQNYEPNGVFKLISLINKTTFGFVHSSCSSKHFNNNILKL